MININPMLAIDAYKFGHMAMHPENIASIYINMTPRSLKYFNRLIPEQFQDNKLVSFGVEMAVKDITDSFNTNFFSKPLSDILPEFLQTAEPFIGENVEAKATLKQNIVNLHNLGYLPLVFKALPEGTVTNPKVPVMTCKATVPGFGWLPNYLETYLSQNIWKTSTVATMARAYRRIYEHYSNLTCDDNSHIIFQGHDFSARGMSSTEDSIKSGIAHLTQFWGSDSVHSALTAKSRYKYQSDLPLAFSVPATEHSVMCLGSTLTSEEYTFKALLTKYNTGIISIVADTYDYWNTISVIASNLKDTILARQPDSMGLCKTVFRPDSGNPEYIICGDYNATEGSNEYRGTLDILWDIFGGTVNSKGFKVLNPKVGLIYGDSITPQRANDILDRMMEKGYAASNIVFGHGSYAYNFSTRDTLGYAVKATAAFTYSGQVIPIQKVVKTDTGKQSACGLLHVTDDLKLIDNCTQEQADTGALKTIFLDGQMFFDTDFSAIRQRAAL